MYDLPQNSISLYSSNPIFSEVDFSSVHLSEISKQIDKFRQKEAKSAVPETDALKFYFGNHLFHVVKSNFNSLQQLSGDEKKLVDKYVKSASDISKRLFYYTLIICVEEARFMHPQDSRFSETIEMSYGKDFVDWVNNGFKGKLSEFGGLDMNVGDMARGLVSVFAFGNWSPGYGGKGWVPIASLASDCIHGRLSFESFSDQAFSLSHNNGSMFNKGHLYSYYSQFIYDILDIQDSGQIPQWIGDNISSKFVDKELKEMFDLSKKLFPEQISGKVNMKLVQNSEKKRRAKEKAIQSNNMATWNNHHHSQQQNKPKPKPDEKSNKILLGL